MTTASHDAAAAAQHVHGFVSSGVHGVAEHESEGDGVGVGGTAVSGASSSKAVLSALRSLQEKIRVLEDERNTLQMCLRQAQEAKEKEEQQHRMLQRQLQLQLQESVKSLTVRHESETDAIRSHANKSQVCMSVCK